MSNLNLAKKLVPYRFCRNSNRTNSGTRWVKCIFKCWVGVSLLAYQLSIHHLPQIGIIESITDWNTAQCLMSPYITWYTYRYTYHNSNFVTVSAKIYRLTDYHWYLLLIQTYMYIVGISVCCAGLTWWWGWWWAVTTAVATAWAAVLIVSVRCLLTWPLTCSAGSSRGRS